MRVLYDQSPIHATSGGNRTYAKELYRALSAHGKAQLHPFAYKRRPSDFGRIGRVLNAAYRDLIHFPVAAWSHGTRFDLLHSTGAPVFAGAPPDKHLITLHDLAILDTPERFSSWSKRYFEAIYLPSLKRCAAILTNSSFTRQRLKNYFPDLDAKTTVTPLAAKDFSCFDPIPVDGLAGDFFLFVGSADPAKNLKLVEASYQEAEARGIRLPPTVVVGMQPFGVGDGRISNRSIQLLSGIDDNQLKWLYQNCRAFLFPSYYEGFGLPILEAMSCGAPVLCGEVCSLPEVAGNAAYFTELTPEAFAQAMQVLHEDKFLRQRLSLAGEQQNARFGWDETASLTEQVYRGICD